MHEFQIASLKQLPGKVGEGAVTDITNTLGL